MGFSLMKSLLYLEKERGRYIRETMFTPPLPVPKPESEGLRSRALQISLNFGRQIVGPEKILLPVLTNNTFVFPFS
jgi:hypothetical protein